MQPIRHCLLTAAACLMPLASSAHTPICTCFNDEDHDNTVICEGGFSDGTSATGVAIRIVDDRNRVLIDGKMDENSEFSFERPSGYFQIVFDAGEGHSVTILEDEIEE